VAAWKTRDQCVEGIVLNWIRANIEMIAIDRNFSNPTGMQSYRFLLGRT